MLFSKGERGGICRDSIECSVLLSVTPSLFALETETIYTAACVIIMA